jgi:hypothetical protein
MVKGILLVGASDIHISTYVTRSLSDYGIVMPALPILRAAEPPQLADSVEGEVMGQEPHSGHPRQDREPRVLVWPARWRLGTSLLYNLNDGLVRFQASGVATLAMQQHATTHRLPQ